MLQVITTNPAASARYAQRMETEQVLAKRRANQAQITHGSLASQLRHAAELRKRRGGDPVFNRQVAVGAVLVARAWRKQLTTHLPK